VEGACVAVILDTVQRQQGVTVQYEHAYHDRQVVATRTFLSTVARSLHQCGHEQRAITRVMKVLQRGVERGLYV
jgi:hypothetical protein